jgi:hypothetical protein
MIGLCHVFNVSEEKIEAKIEELGNCLCMDSAIGSHWVWVIRNMREKDLYDSRVTS